MSVTHRFHTLSYLNFVQEPILLYSQVNYEESGHMKYFCVRFLLEVQKMCINVVLMEWTLKTSLKVILVHTVIKLIKHCVDSRILTIFCVQLVWSNVASNFCLESWEQLQYRKKFFFSNEQICTLLLLT